MAHLLSPILAVERLSISALTRLWLLLLCLGCFHLGLACAALGDAYSAGGPLSGPLLQLGIVGLYAGYALLCVVRALRLPRAIAPTT